MVRRLPIGQWEVALLVLLVGVFILNSFLSPYFLDLYNLIDSTFSFSEKALVALPMALLIIKREIDVSVASIVALACVMMGVAGDLGAGTATLVLVGITVGTLAGLLNGAFVCAFGVHSIVVTIGTLSLYRGIVVLIAGDEAFTSFPSGFAWFGQHYLGGYLPVEFLIYVIATVVFGVLLHVTPFGRKIFALGTNPDAAVYSGVSHTRYRMILFSLTGFMCGLAAILLTSRLGSVRLNVATGWELQVITMVVLGGVSIAGGSGSILGVTLAVFLIGLLTFGLSLINVPGIVLNIYIGLMLVSAIALPRLYSLIRSRRLHGRKES